MIAKLYNRNKLKYGYRKVFFEPTGNPEDFSLFIP